MSGSRDESRRFPLPNDGPSKDHSSSSRFSDRRSSFRPDLPIDREYTSGILRGRMGPPSGPNLMDRPRDWDTPSGTGSNSDRPEFSRERFPSSSGADYPSERPEKDDVPGGYSARPPLGSRYGPPRYRGPPPPHPRDRPRYEGDRPGPPYPGRNRGYREPPPRDPRDRGFRPPGPGPYRKGGPPPMPLDYRRPRPMMNRDPYSSSQSRPSSPLYPYRFDDRTDPSKLKAFDPSTPGMLPPSANRTSIPLDSRDGPSSADSLANLPSVSSPIAPRAVMHKPVISLSRSSMTATMTPKKKRDTDSLSGSSDEEDDEDDEEMYDDDAIAQQFERIDDEIAQQERLLATIRARKEEEMQRLEAEAKRLEQEAEDEEQSKEMELEVEEPETKSRGKKKKGSPKKSTDASEKHKDGKRVSDKRSSRSSTKQKQYLPDLLLEDIRSRSLAHNSQSPESDDLVVAQVLENNRKLATAFQHRLDARICTLTQVNPTVVMEGTIVPHIDETDPIWQDDLESYQKIRPSLLKHVAKRKLSQFKLQMELESQYEVYYTKWRKHVDALEAKEKKAKAKKAGSNSASSSAPITNVSHAEKPSIAAPILTNPDKKVLASPPPPVSARSTRRTGIRGDVVRTEEEWQSALQLLGIVPDNTEERVLERSVADPPMVTGAEERRAQAFASKNGLVVDAAADLAQFNSAKGIKWSDEEKDIFKIRLLQFGKDFPKLATFLPTKTTQDCVHYYYKEKINLRFKALLRRSAAMSRGRRRKERLESTVAPAPFRAYILRSDEDIIPMKAPYSPVLAFDEDSIKAMERQEEKRLMAARFRRERARSEDINQRKRAKQQLPERSLSRPATPSTPMLARQGSVERATPPSVDDDALHRVGSSTEDLFRVPEVPSSSTAFQKPSAVSRQDSSSSVASLNLDFPGVEDWTEEEMSRALRALELFGREFEQVALVVKTKTADQCKAFYNNYRRKNKEAKKALETTGGVQSAKKKGKDEKKDKKRAPTGKGKKRLGDDESIGTDEELMDDEQNVDSEGRRLGKRARKEDGDESVEKKRRKARKKTISGVSIDTDSNVGTVDYQQFEDVSGGGSPSRDDGTQSVRKTISYWSVGERSDFTKALAKWGRNWDAIARELGTKSSIQVRNHFHNFKDKLNFDAILLQHGHIVDDSSSPAVQTTEASGMVNPALPQLVHQPAPFPHQGWANYVPGYAPTTTMMSPYPATPTQPPPGHVHPSIVPPNSGMVVSSVSASGLPAGTAPYDPRFTAYAGPIPVTSGTMIYQGYAPYAYSYPPEYAAAIQYGLMTGDGYAVEQIRKAQQLQQELVYGQGTAATTAGALSIQRHPSPHPLPPQPAATPPPHRASSLPPPNHLSSFGASATVSSNATNTSEGSLQGSQEVPASMPSVQGPLSAPDPVQLSNISVIQTPSAQAETAVAPVESHSQVSAAQSTPPQPAVDRATPPSSVQRSRGLLDVMSIVLDEDDPARVATPPVGPPTIVSTPVHVETPADTTSVPTTVEGQDDGNNDK